MKCRKNKFNLGFIIALLTGILTAFAQAQPTVPTGKPEAAIDLATNEGAQLVKGVWRYSDTKIVEVDFKAPGADKQPTGKPIKTYDRSEERRVGKECLWLCRSRWSPYH